MEAVRRSGTVKPGAWIGACVATVWAVVAAYVLAGCSPAKTADTRPSQLATAPKTGPFRGPTCALITEDEFLSVLGPSLGAGTDSQAGGSGVVARSCDAIKTNGDSLIIIVYDFPTGAQARSSYTGLTTNPPLGQRLSLPPRLAPSEYASRLVRGGVTDSALFLDGTHELYMVAIAAPADAALLNTSNFLTVAVSVAHRWRAS